MNHSPFAAFLRVLLPGSDYELRDKLTYTLRDVKRAFEAGMGHPREPRPTDRVGDVDRDTLYWLAYSASRTGRGKFEIGRGRIGERFYVSLTRDGRQTPIASGDARHCYIELCKYLSEEMTDDTTN